MLRKAQCITIASIWGNISLGKGIVSQESYQNATLHLKNYLLSQEKKIERVLGTALVKPLKRIFTNDKEKLKVSFYNDKRASLVCFF